jgi:hypothetical protein
MSSGRKHHQDSATDTPTGSNSEPKTMKICLNIRLNGKKEFEEAIDGITKLIQEAATISTPAIKHQFPE